MSGSRRLAAVRATHGRAPLTPSQNTPEYLFEGSHEKARTRTETLFYSTGIAYMVGQTIGGSWGLVEGLQHRDGSTFRLRVNAVLNACTRRGPFLANNFGVIALMYNGGTASVRALPLPVPDEAAGVLAGAVAGAVYKCTSACRRLGVLAVKGWRGLLCLRLGLVRAVAVSRGGWPARDDSRLRTCPARCRRRAQDGACGRSWRGAGPRRHAGRPPPLQQERSQAGRGPLLIFIACSPFFI